MTVTAAPDAAIADAFKAKDEAAQAALLHLRDLIYEVARETPTIGEISESLKWGQPSYTPVKPRVGSSVRLGVLEDGKVALYFICHTHLVTRFREIYGDTLTYEGDRALLLDVGAAWPEDALKHCIAMALTYKLRS
ncbi:unnamed protein product [Laminaria digitata]